MNEDNEPGFPSGDYYPSSPAGSVEAMRAFARGARGNPRKKRLIRVGFFALVVVPWVAFVVYAVVHLI